MLTLLVINVMFILIDIYSQNSINSLNTYLATDIKGIHHDLHGGSPETTTLSHVNATNFL